MSTPTRPPIYRPRLIEHAEVQGRRRRRLRLPVQGLRGMLAGVEAVVLGWLVVVVPAVGTYVATAADPVLSSAGWVQAAQMGTTGWFLAHGSPVRAGDATISVVPIGLTLLCIFLSSTAVRRARLASWAPVLAAVVTYVALAGALLMLAPAANPWAGLLGAAVVATLGTLWGMRARFPQVPGRLAKVDPPVWLRTAARGTAFSCMALAGTGFIALLIAMVTGFEQVLDGHRSLHTDPVSTAVLILAQFLVLPVLVVWAAAYLLGPGFSVGTGTMVSAHGIESGPLPLIPLLGALPEPQSIAADLPMVVVLGLLVGLGAGWWLVRRLGAAPMWQSYAALGVLTFGVAALVALLGLLTAGSIGPGAMVTFGPDPLDIGVAAAWQVGVGGLVGVTCPHPATRAAFKRMGRWVRARTVPARAQS